MPKFQNTEINRLLGIMSHLRDPLTGCDWDRVQTFDTIIPYTIEEAYEVAEAIHNHDMVSLRDELGDLLLQVVFHARIAEELGHFDFHDVAASIATKLERRHPHIFAQSMPSPEIANTSQTERWETLKAEERAAKGENSAMDGVAISLPAMMRAEKLQKRAARVGFDWPDPTGAANKVQEELNELAEASPEDKLEEAGDLLFAAVNLVRLNGIAPEDALRRANDKFSRRFKEMENLAKKAGEDFSTLSLDQQEAYWQKVKALEKKI